MPRIQFRRGTSSQWTTANPILLDTEIGVETDTRKRKEGDGVTSWNNLPYKSESSSGTIDLSGYSTTVESDAKYQQKGIYLTDAPNNNYAYVRKGGAWVLETVGSGGGSQFINPFPLLTSLKRGNAKTTIKLLGDSITYGSGATGNGPTTEVIIGSNYVANSTPKTWANLLSEYVSTKFDNKERFIPYDSPEIIINSTGYSYVTTPVKALRLMNNSANATAKMGFEFSFYGDLLVIEYQAINNAGNVDVYIDGVLNTNINTYVSGSEAKSITIAGLSVGQHTLRIEETGVKTNAPGYFYLTGLKVKKYASVKNYGVYGWGSSTILQYITTLVKSDDDIIILQIGTNDRGMNTTLFENNLKAITEYLKSQGKELIIMSSSPVLPVAETSTNSMVDINNTIASFAILNKIPFISNFQGFLDFLRYRNISLSTLLADNVHPNDAGYKVMFESTMEGLGLGRLPDGQTY